MDIPDNKNREEMNGRVWRKMERGAENNRHESGNERDGNPKTALWRSNEAHLWKETLILPAAKKETSSPEREM
ncbi:hypothetical protein NDU88_000575 [Pleurodeles waltl]|uniref:Uncharacterized protein n=1 Tax=Pleurodeles waltl TaxID=8319 RepID=A0AAV7WFW6_PLEWA|nr:hypothetical protein NDU88_000575 [Pleurodeles waltl]